MQPDSRRRKTPARPNQAAEIECQGADLVYRGRVGAILQKVFVRAPDPPEEWRRAEDRRDQEAINEATHGSR